MASPAGTDASSSSSSSAAAALPSTPPASPPASLSSPPHEMYMMPFLPPPSPLPPPYSYPHHLHHESLQQDEGLHNPFSLPDYPFCPPPPPPSPFFPTPFQEGFGEEDCYSWNEEALFWTDTYSAAPIGVGGLLEGGVVGGGSEPAAPEGKPAGGDGGGATLLPPELPPEPQQQQQLGLPELQVQQWSGMAKAARSKRRIARQMSNCVVPRFVLPRRSSSSSSSSSPTAAGAAAPHGKGIRRNPGGFLAMTKKSPPFRAMPLFPPVHMGLRYVLHKELKNSDVTTLGRIVLPKRESEIHLPFLAVKEGIQITVRDMFSPDAWRMRYRFWPNNKSRMYVLENTGDYVKKNGLRCGDMVALYQDESKQLYICARKVENPQFYPSFMGCMKEMEDQYTFLLDVLPEKSDEKVECSFINTDASIMLK